MRRLLTGSAGSLRCVQPAAPTTTTPERHHGEGQSCRPSSASIYSVAAAALIASLICLNVTSRRTCGLNSGHEAAGTRQTRPWSLVRRDRRRLRQWCCRQNGGSSAAATRPVGRVHSIGGREAPYRRPREMLTAEGVVSRLDMYARWRSRWDGVVPFKPRFRSWAGCEAEAMRRGRAEE